MVVYRPLAVGTPYRPTNERKDRTEIDGIASAESCLHELCRVMTEIDEISEILAEAIQYGIPLRQLSRMTGISYGVIQRLNGKLNEKVRS